MKLFLPINCLSFYSYRFSAVVFVCYVAIKSVDESHSLCGYIELSCTSSILLHLIKINQIYNQAILRKLLCPDLPMFYLMPRYLFNGICFHFHLASQEFPAVHIYMRTPNCSSKSYATDKRTDGQTDTGPHFIMPMKVGGIIIIN